MNVSKKIGKKERLIISSYPRLILSLLLSISLILPAYSKDSNKLENIESIQSYFSPNGGCTEAIVAALRMAQESVLVQAYSFTSEPIANALVEAHKRKVVVTGIFDKGQDNPKRSLSIKLKDNGITIFFDRNHAISHNKVIIIDGETVLTGSFNFSRAAEYSNAENLLVIKDKRLASIYTEEWLAHMKHSEEKE